MINLSDPRLDVVHEFLDATIEHVTLFATKANLGALRLVLDTIGDEVRVNPVEKLPVKIVHAIPLLRRVRGPHH